MKKRLASRDFARTTRVLVLAGGLAAWCVDRVEVVGTSMSPTFAPGDRLVAIRRWRPLRQGDVVVLTDPTSPHRQIVKRVRAIDGARATVLGDNEAASTDSRSFGDVPVASIRHLVVRRYARGGGA